MSLTTRRPRGSRSTSPGSSTSFRCCFEENTEAIFWPPAFLGAAEPQSAGAAKDFLSEAGGSRSGATHHWAHVLLKHPVLSVWEICVEPSTSWQSCNWWRGHQLAAMATPLPSTPHCHTSKSQKIRPQRLLYDTVTNSSKTREKVYLLQTRIQWKGFRNEQREEVTYLRKTDLARLVTIEISSLKSRIAQATILVTQNQQRLWFS